MCGAKSQPMPTPQAPPEPTPVRDSQIEARGDRQASSRRAASSGYQATLLTDSKTNAAAPTASPVLGY